MNMSVDDSHEITVRPEYPRPTLSRKPRSQTSGTDIPVRAAGPELSGRNAGVTFNGGASGGFPSALLSGVARAWA